MLLLRWHSKDKGARMTQPATGDARQQALLSQAVKAVAEGDVARGASEADVPVARPSGVKLSATTAEQTPDDGSVTRRKERVPRLKIGDEDGCGRRIDNIYFMRNEYIIYCAVRPTDSDAEKHVIVYYSDNESTATQQIAAVAELVPLRNQLQFLLVGLPEHERYYVRIAEAFRLGLEQEADVAKRTLEETVAEVKSILEDRGRQTYVGQSMPRAAIGAGVLWVSAAFLLGQAGADSPLHAVGNASLSGGAGAVGALLSIAISVRARTLDTQGSNGSVKMDALLRVLIGIISGTILCLMAQTGALPELTVNDLTFGGGKVEWGVALVLGFCAGFLERLVPDIVAKQDPA